VQSTQTLLRKQQREYEKMCGTFARHVTAVLAMCSKELSDDGCASARFPIVPSCQPARALVQRGAAPVVDQVKQVVSVSLLLAEALRSPFL